MEKHNVGKGRCSKGNKIKELEMVGYGRWMPKEDYFLIKVFMKASPSYGPWIDQKTT